MAFNDYITREEMGYIVANGGSVLYKGQVITSQDQLHSKLELAGDNEEDQKVYAQEMEAEIKRQQAQLDAAKKAAEESKAEKAKAVAAPEKAPAANEKK